VWTDAESHALDHSLDDIEEHPLPERRSIGFLARAGKTHITLVGTDDRYAAGEDIGVEMIGDALRIPKAIVKKIIPLKEDKTLVREVASQRGARAKTGRSPRKRR
jgi:hypothetical protein